MQFVYILEIPGTFFNLKLEISSLGKSSKQTTIRESPVLNFFCSLPVDSHFYKKNVLNQFIYLLFRRHSDAK